MNPRDQLEDISKRLRGLVTEYRQKEKPKLGGLVKPTYEGECQQLEKLCKEIDTRIASKESDSKSSLSMSDDEFKKKVLKQVGNLYAASMHIDIQTDTYLKSLTSQFVGIFLTVDDLIQANILTSKESLEDKAKFLLAWEKEHPKKIDYSFDDKEKRDKGLGSWALSLQTDYDKEHAGPTIERVLQVWTQDAKQLFREHLNLHDGYFKKALIAILGCEASISNENIVIAIEDKIKNDRSFTLEKFQKDLLEHFTLPKDHKSVNEIGKRCSSIIDDKKHHHFTRGLSVVVADLVSKMTPLQLMAMVGVPVGYALEIARSVPLAQKAEALQPPVETSKTIK